jgi:DNA repair photolyase
MGTSQITHIAVKSVLTAQNPRGSLPYDYTINPYRGCLFGCSYCYASRFVHEDTARKADWGHWVEVKHNAVDALQRESHKIVGKRVFFSSATDPYQPIELRLKLTQALLQVLLLAFPAHLHIQTRSPHVVRDLPLFEQFGDALTVGISMPTDSDVVRKAFEPRAPSISRRLQAAQTLQEAGICTIASVGPLLPCTPKRLARLLRPSFQRAWIERLHFYEQAERLQALYHRHGWEKYLLPEHEEAVRQALQEAGLLK